MPAIRSLMWTRPSENLRDTVQQQFAQTQAQIAQTQAQVAQATNNLNEQVQKVHDEIGNNVGVGDYGQTVIEYVSPSQKTRVKNDNSNKKLIITDDGLTEEMTASYISPDGNARGFAKSSRTMLTSKLK